LTLLARVGTRAPTSSKHTPGQQHAIWATHTLAAIDLVCSDGQRRCEYKRGDRAMDTQRIPRRAPRADNRGRGEGSIHQRSDGRWAGTVMFSLNPNPKPDRPKIHRKTRGKDTSCLRTRPVCTSGGRSNQTSLWTVRPLVRAYLAARARGVDARYATVRAKAKTMECKPPPSCCRQSNDVHQAAR